MTIKGQQTGRVLDPGFDSRPKIDIGMYGHNLAGQRE